MRPAVEVMFRSSKPFAFVDESFETQGTDTFYILAVVMITASRLQTVRSRLEKLNGGHAIHASHLNAKRDFELIELAVELLAHDHDSAEVIFASPLLSDDRNGEATRQKCLAQALVTIHREYEVSVAVLDSRKLKDADDSDRRTISDLRKTGHLPRDFKLLHAWPAEELLLGLPDILAWTYRQTVTKNEPRWFETLASEVRVTEISDELR